MMQKYKLTYIARNILFGLFWPCGYIIFYWNHDVLNLELPVFITPWIMAWAAGLILNLALPKAMLQVLAAAVWITFLGGYALFVNEPLGTMVLVQAFICAITWLLFEWYEYQYQLAKTFQEEKEYAKILESRIRPHFLFNVLNSLSAMADKDSTIKKGIDDAADLMRMALTRENTFSNYVTERDVAECYLRLEYIRLENRLCVEWDVDEEIEDTNPSMPGFLLQPLLENAIRHGIEQIEGIIKITLYKKNNYIHIEISNPTLDVTSAIRGLGIAEKDIQRRLMILYDAQIKYTRTRLGNQMIVSIDLPWTV